MAKRFSFVGQASDSKKVCANKTNLQTKLVRAILYILSVLASLTVVTLISKNLFDYICGFFVVAGMEYAGHFCKRRRFYCCLHFCN